MLGLWIIEVFTFLMTSRSGSKVPAAGKKDHLGNGTLLGFSNRINSAFANDKV
jgi:hypothetical protein